MKPYRVAAVALALALMAGCQGKPDPGVTPYTSISPSATPTTPVPTPTPVKAKLDAEAKERYRGFLVEQYKVLEAGGTDSLSPQIDAFLEEPYRSVLLKVFTDMKANGVRVTGTELSPEPKIEVIDESAVPGALVAIRTCLDGTKTTVVRPDGSSVPAEVVENEYWFKRDAAGVLRIFYGAGKEVDKC